MDKSLLSISPLDRLNPQKIPKIPGYYIASTAPLNIEGDEPSGSEHPSPKTLNEKINPQEEQNLEKLVDSLYRQVTTREESNSNPVEIIISIHGFSNDQRATENRVNQIHQHINEDKATPIQDRANSLTYIGYRWPSEPLMGGNWCNKFRSVWQALPLLPRGILVIGFIAFPLSFVSQVRNFLFYKPLLFLPLVAFLVLMFLFFFICSLVILRLLVYFRDYYRATNFGVLDLVELIRQFDQALVSKVKEQYLQEAVCNKFERILKKRIKTSLNLQNSNLNSIDEQTIDLVCKLLVKNSCKNKTIDFKQVLNEVSSLSTQVETRIEEIVALATNILETTTDEELTEIRDKAINHLEKQASSYWEKYENRIKITFIGHSMGGYVVTSVVRILSDVFDLSSVGNLNSTNKFPTSTIGRVFRLGRLVLISPDIPINSILSGRANFLRSSLRRFEETYLFSNQGDLALRLASTVANYFSFPARTRESGYRLGNVAIKDNKYGIFNLKSLKRPLKEQQEEWLENLSLDSLNMSRGKSRKSLADLQKCYQNDGSENTEQISSLFTYFDCTDYEDITEPKLEKRRVLTLKKGRWEPGLIYYARLTIAFALNRRDTHGGYFQGQFSQQAMYRLAFLGFSGFLDSLAEEHSKTSFSQEQLEKLTQIEQEVIHLSQLKQTEVNQKISEYKLALPEKTDPTIQAQLEQLQQQKENLIRHQTGLAYLCYKCNQTNIQVILSPERYEVEILGRDREQVRKEMLEPVNSAGRDRAQIKRGQLNV